MELIENNEKAALYVRVSTDAQREEGYSIDAQKEALEGYCKARGFKNSVLKESLRDCLNVEEEIKKGIIADKLGVELLIVKYSK